MKKVIFGIVLVFVSKIMIIWSVGLSLLKCLLAIPNCLQPGAYCRNGGICKNQTGNTAEPAKVNFHFILHFINAAG